MTADIMLGLGGVGLFLLGMAILTSSLRDITGDGLRQILVRFTSTPLRGALAGAAATAAMQSSSATTVLAVGFVGAGVLSFSQGLGIVFGANVGTTITGWMVAIIGFKLKLGPVALMFVLAGALLHLFGRGRARQVGWAIAGFGLLFVGIDAMQQGLSQFQNVVTPASFPEDTYLGRLQLVAIGIAVTVLTQSSSAGVAAALVALSTGSISFAQAAAMVIGMNVGTTITALVATIGGSTAMRQTGYAHVVYNVLTGVVAFFLLGPYVAVASAWFGGDGLSEPEIALVTFHTAFNVLGTALAVPLAGPFARLIIRLVPERGPPLLRRLEERLLREPHAALAAAVETVRDITRLLLEILVGLTDPRRPARLDLAKLRIVDEGLEATRSFLERIRTGPEEESLYARHMAAMHALDHLFRLSNRCRQTRRVEILHTQPRLRRLSSLLHATVARALAAETPDTVRDRLEWLWDVFRRQRQRFREGAVAGAARREFGAQTTLHRLDSMRWLNRVSYHLWRIYHHLGRAGEEHPGPLEGTDRALDIMDD
ncbi:MAG: Na/Pi symporter [Alphaproteobacteria bacterium]